MATTWSSSHLVVTCLLSLAAGALLAPRAAPPPSRYPAPAPLPPVVDLDAAPPPTASGSAATTDTPPPPLSSSSSPAAARLPRPLAEAQLRETLGEHVLLEASRASPAVLDDLAAVTSAVTGACASANLTVIDVKAHRFAPQGVSVVAILAESHLRVHPWPEKSYASVDCYTCGLEKPGRAEHAARFVAQALESSQFHISRVPRGIPSAVFAAAASQSVLLESTPASEL